MTPPRRFTPAEDDELRRLCVNHTAKEIARAVKRDYTSIRRRLAKLGLRTKTAIIGRPTNPAFTTFWIDRTAAEVMAEWRQNCRAVIAGDML